MKLYTGCLLVILGLLFITSCSKKPDLTVPDCGLTSDHINNEIIIIPFDETNTYKVNDPFSFTILLKEKDLAVIAPMNFNSQIFTYEDSTNKWIAVKNNVSYLGISPKLDSNNDRLSFVVRPHFDTKKNKTIIFLCISGVVENKPDIEVGASYLFVLRK